jgi:hypothetical protein
MLVVSIIFLLAFMVLLFRPYVKLLHEVRPGVGAGLLGGRGHGAGDRGGGACSGGLAAAPARPGQGLATVTPQPC